MENGRSPDNSNNMENNRRKPLQRVRGISLRTVNVFMMALAVILAVSLLIVTARVFAGYDALQEATEEYIVCQQSAQNLRMASDYLTDRARSFIATGKMEYADDFFEEVGVTRRRDKAVEVLEQYTTQTDTGGYLREALQCSNELAEIEAYAIRLEIAAMDMDLAQFPASVQAVVLQEEDLALTPAEQSDRALAMMFDETYQDYKSRIYGNVSKCTDALIAYLQNEQNSASANLQALLRVQRLLLGLLVCLFLISEILTMVLVLVPLRRFYKKIEQQQLVETTGSSEVRRISEIYNRMFLETRTYQDQLSYKATHDALTDLYNRDVFDQQKELLAHTDTSTLIVIDVDKFKQINDTYGHDMGDRVLKRVSSLLKHSFRADDYVCRIGGDEFAIIMVHTGSALRHLVDAKLSAIKETLRQPDQDMPVVTLSIGVAFGDRANGTDDIFKDADKVLYEVKAAGGNGFRIYE